MSMWVHISAVVLVLLPYISCAADDSKTEVQEVDFCKVVKVPSTYNGTVVKIRGRVVSDFESLLLNSSKCAEENRNIWISFPDDTNIRPKPQFKLRRDERFRAFIEKLKAKCEPEPEDVMVISCQKYTITATFIGRIDDALIEIRKETPEHPLPGYGTLNAYRVRLVVHAVMDVSTSPVPEPQTR